MLSEQSLRNFMHRRQRTLILRSHAPDPKDVPFRVEQIRETVAAFDGITIEDKPSVSRIHVLVFANKRRYADLADCGQTAAAMRAALGTHTPINKIPIDVEEMEDGDLFCVILNHAVDTASRKCSDYSLIVSQEVRQYVNKTDLTAMYQAAADGARAVGLALNELHESICRGRLANTFAMWHNKSLTSVGGFNLLAAMRPKGPGAVCITGFSREKQRTSGDGEVIYALHGVEEMIPLAEMISVYGPCIAPIVPHSQGAAYQVASPEERAALYLRHLQKMGTKAQRQAAMLALVHRALDYLEAGIIEKYRVELPSEMGS